MRTITIKVREIDEHDAIEAKFECNKDDSASELEVFTAHQIVQALNFVLNSGMFMPEALTKGSGPLCDMQTGVQLDILKAGRKS